ncbi:hypothetical protein ACS0TY_021600 [Phlomoides rotata]
MFFLLSNMDGMLELARCTGCPFFQSFKESITFQQCVERENGEVDSCWYLGVYHLAHLESEKLLYLP